MFCSDEFMQDTYRTLAQDREFMTLLRSGWQIDLPVRMLSLYRMLVMYRQPLISTDFGYHRPSSEEVIAGIRAYFDSSHLSGDAVSSTVDKGTNSQQIRAEVLGLFRTIPTRSTYEPEDYDIQGLLLKSIRGYLSVLPQPGFLDPYVVQHVQGDNLTVPSELSAALSRVSTVDDLKLLLADFHHYSAKLGRFLSAWIDLHICLENPDAETACECPFCYYFVKYCLDQGWGVPKLALALYDRMNMQLSREFIRCANPTCELNKLDQSTGHVKFKKCSRCQAVIYCSRECQVAHYPEHKRLCREHLKG